MDIDSQSCVQQNENMDIESRSCVKQDAVTTWEINIDRITAMEHKLSVTPKLLSVGAGRTTCSIFKVPKTLININNGKSFQPNIVSIGPFHHGQPHLEMIEEHKWRFLRQLLNRTKEMVLEDLLRAVQPLEVATRECYSTTIPYSSDELIEMMVLDGCFIIELFRKIGGLVEADDYDPLLKMSWIFSFFLRDLIGIENQIPFFVLERLFELTITPKSPTLATLALDFFNETTQRRPKVLEKYSNIEAKHLLDLLRSSFLPSKLKRSTKPDNHPPQHLIHSISKLRRSGIKIKLSEEESFVMVDFKHGVIHMPSITIDDFMCSFLINAVAFEQCHTGCFKIFTTYVTLIDCLINTSKDVGLLCDWDIIENYLGTEAEVATFFNNMGKDVSFDINTCYLAQLFDDVKKHDDNGWHVQWATFRYTYFNTPWSFISALAALVLLVLTVAQTLYTILSYTRSP